MILTCSIIIVLTLLREFIPRWIFYTLFGVIYAWLTWQVFG